MIFRPLTHENGVDTLILIKKNPYKCVNKARSFIYGSSLFALIFKIDTDFGARSRKLGESLVEQAGTLFTLGAAYRAIPAGLPLVCLYPGYNKL